MPNFRTLRIRCMIHFLLALYLSGSFGLTIPITFLGGETVV